MHDGQVTGSARRPQPAMGRRDFLRWGGSLLAAALLAACRARGAARTVDVELELTTAGEQMAFEQTMLTLAAGQHARLTLHNRSSVLQHNWVLVNGDDTVAAQVYAQALTTGAERNFIPDAPELLAHTTLVAPGASASVAFTAPAEPGRYTYICTFPGHYLAGMKGTLEVTAP